MCCPHRCNTHAHDLKLVKKTKKMPSNNQANSMIQQTHFRVHGNAFFLSRKRTLKCASRSKHVYGKPALHWYKLCPLVRLTMTGLPVQSCADGGGQCSSCLPSWLVSFLVAQAEWFWDMSSASIDLHVVCKCYSVQCSTRCVQRPWLSQPVRLTHDLALSAQLIIPVDIVITNNLISNCKVFFFFFFFLLA